MNKKMFDHMSEALKCKLKNCKDEAELQELLKAADDVELSDEELENVSGGIEENKLPDLTRGIDMPELPDERIDCHGFFNHP